MAKPLPLIVGGVGLTGAAAGGVLLARGGSSTSREGTTTVRPQKQAEVQEEKFFESVEAFKSDAKSNSCVKGQFGELTISVTSASDITSSQPGSSDFFKTGEDVHTSCLIIHWKKNTNAQDQKWNGKFTWLWTFVKGDEGFINFNVAEPSTTENKLKFTGAFYLLKKESNVWNIKHKKEITNGSKEAGKDDWDSHFPKASDALKNDHKLYWDFIDEEKADLEKVCKSGDSTTCQNIASAPLTTKKLKWTSSKSSEPNAKSIWDWSSSEEWWNKIYSPNGWKLKEKLTTIKGTWTAEAGNTAQ